MMRFLQWPQKLGESESAVLLLQTRRPASVAILYVVLETFESTSTTQTTILTCSALNWLLMIPCFLAIVTFVELRAVMLVQLLRLPY